MIDILSPNLMILASAGSGKTYQLGNRVIGLVGAQGVDPEKIVALTFTRKAAGEFADSVLSKLAACAADPAQAAELCEKIGKAFEVPPVLAKVVRALPRFQLGTMDGFFTRIVRGFQYELGLTGGTFDLIEGPRLETAMADILASVLGDALDDGRAEEFLQAFRRATLGKEGQGVLTSIEKFLGSWHGLWKHGVPPEGWGGAAVFGVLPNIDEWEKQKTSLLDGLRRFNPPAPILKLIDQFQDHTVGSGRVADNGGVLFGRFAESVHSSGEIEVPFGRKALRLSAPESDQWRAVFQLLAACELSAAVVRTRAVGDLVGRLDDECQRRLRAKGLLGFDDVKVLMGLWARDEDSRLRREAVDFRLDARYDHWLLDEFQDTSAAEWTGILPLLDEVASREDGTLFVVGDRKQAIYGWRGGDVSLFDQVETRYGGNGRLDIHPMPESWRSCPAVLELVNRIFGDSGTIRSLFGEAMAERWIWEPHVSAKPGVAGEARVEIVSKDDADERLVELLREIGIGSRALTCGVLVRTNAQVNEVATLLREHGFDVIEEGRRHPTEDNAVGVALFHLIRWLADPADNFAREVILMSPLAARLEACYGADRSKQWEGLLDLAQRQGFATMAAELLEPLWEALSEFARRRAGDVIGALGEFDAGAASTAREAVRWLEGLEISQSPGAAAVQVMTVHKSKGLGFDVVVVPEISDRQIPNHGNYDVARGTHEGSTWLLAPPPRWVRGLVPALAAAEAAWADNERYESMCVLYVALTRAKRGLYVLLPEVPEKRPDADAWTSLANWVARSSSGTFQCGDPSWFTAVAERGAKPEPAAPTLAAAVPKRVRTTPSGVKKEAAPALSPQGLRFGLAVHAAFEQVGWIDEQSPRLPDDEAGRMVARLLQRPDVKPWFERRGRHIELYREQPVEAIIDGEWLSGILDRLHLHRDESGRVTALDVIDFKTDRVNDPGELLERYAAQMQAYRTALGRGYPGAEIRLVIVSTSLGLAIGC